MGYQFADKAVENLNLLLSHTVLTFSGFMNHSFLNESVEQFDGQFRGIGILLDESDLHFGIQSGPVLVHSGLFFGYFCLDFFRPFQFGS